MRRPALLAAPALFGLLGAACTTVPTGCPTGFLAAVADHLVSKIPLDTQTDCAGASRVPFNVPQSLAGGDGMCEADDIGNDCLACLSRACCALVAETCVGQAAAACAANEAITSCFLTAQEGGCCPGSDGGKS